MLKCLISYNEIIHSSRVLGYVPIPLVGSPLPAGQAGRITSLSLLVMISGIILLERLTSLIADRYTQLKDSRILLRPFRAATLYASVKVGTLKTVFMK